MKAMKISSHISSQAAAPNMNILWQWVAYYQQLGWERPDDNMGDNYNG
jgi:hypothetical protein